MSKVISITTVVRPSVLIVEDHEDSREMLVEYLSFHNFQVHASSTISDGVKLNQEYDPDIVLIDLSLPTLSAACAAIRRLRAPHTSNQFIIGLNGFGFQGHAELATKAGCDIVVSKPFDLEMLSAMLLQERVA